ncbi:MAG: DUF1844 domain-containing protein [Kiritimatiellae bacterium]|nr:DUF1844 domain-containing protein [Kiritimatiellia bacterium]
MSPDREPEPTPFISLLGILATHAMTALGAGGPNERNEVYVDLEFASHLIEILHDLDEKTRGRRTPEEDAAIAETISGLQLSFVRVSDLAVRAQRGGAPADAPAAPAASVTAGATPPTPAGAEPTAPPPVDEEKDRPPRFQKKYG